MNKKTLIVLPLMLLMALVLLATSVMAQVTPAGTQIRNRSSATYEDMSGNSFTATSNEVITVVLPVYGLTILPDGTVASPAMTQNALAGQTVYYRYDLTNTGNDNDTFDLFPLVDAATTMALVPADVTIYHDLNGNGLPDVGEPVVSSGGATGSVGPLTTGQTVSLVVAYTVPGGASAGDLGYVGVDGTSQNDAGQNDTGNLHETTVVNDAVMSANLTGAPATVFEGQQITYTLSGTNVGNNTANGVTVPSVGLTGVLMYDVIPTDGGGAPLPVFGTPTGVPAGGTVLYLNTGNSTAGSPETWNWSTTSGPGDIAVGYITNGGVVVGQSYSFAYQVTVPVGMPAGVLANTATVAYVDNNGGTPDPTLVVSNNAPVTIGGTADVLIGTAGNAQAGTGPGYNDDVQSVASASAGTSVDFTNTIRNDGNASDQVNVLLDGTSTVPGSWTVLFFQSDGVTPLVDTGVDGIPDTGPLAPGDSVDVVVRLVIPGSQAAGGPFDAVIRAQSTNDPLVSNLTTDRVLTVTPAGVDIGNYDGVVGTTNNTPVNQNTNPGTQVDFALDVLNTSGATDTYSLSSTLPGGWTVTYYDDANGNGVLDAGEVTPIGSVGPVAAGGEANVIARVDVPAGEAAAVYGTTFTATSTNNGTISDSIANTVTVQSFAAIDFTPDLAGTATPGATVSYTHTVTNTGNEPDTWDLSYVSSQGWTYSFFDGANNPITAVTLAPLASTTVVARLSVPAGATIGTVETGVLTVTGQVTLSTDDATDVTVIVAGDLDLTKAVNPLGDQVPGTVLTYTTDYQNLGTDSLTTIVVMDPIPSFTQFSVGSASGGTPPATITAVAASFSDDGGATWTYVPVSGGGGAPAGFDANVTNVRFVMTGVLESGASSTVGVSFDVRIIAE